MNLILMGLNMRDGFTLAGRGKPLDRVKLMGREMIANGSMAFHISRPKSFEHKAGQWVRLTLPDPAETDSKGASRVLSIVSAPHEAQLTVATRLTDSAFKRCLKELPDGANLRIAGPSGNFTLHEDPDRPAVFIAGGIGITPFLSMIRHVTHAGVARKIKLFYSSREPAVAAFLSELEELEKAHPNFQLVATMTALEEGSAPWRGETDLINQEMLARHLPDLGAPIYYCAGPAPMVGATKDMLKAAGVASQDVIVEQFTGY